MGAIRRPSPDTGEQPEPGSDADLLAHLSLEPVRGRLRRPTSTSSGERRVMPSDPDAVLGPLAAELGESAAADRLALAEARERIVTLERQRDEAEDAVYSSERALAELRLEVTKLERERDGAYAERDELARQAREQSGDSSDQRRPRPTPR